MTETEPTPTEVEEPLFSDPPPFSDLLRRVEGLKIEASYVTAPGLKAVTDLLHELILELQVTLKPPVLYAGPVDPEKLVSLPPTNPNLITSAPVKEANKKELK